MLNPRNSRLSRLLSERVPRVLSSLFTLLQFIQDFLYYKFRTIAFRWATTRPCLYLKMVQSRSKKMVISRAKVAASATTLLALAIGSKAQETYPATPLASKHFSYPSGIPYQVDSDPQLIRGSQYGYNICNSTTEGQDSLCQTAFINYLDDFCLWGPPDPNSLIGDTEGESVAWCTKPGRGTRVIPPGALQGVQYMRTPDYVQVVGYIDQSLINIAPEDYGGEMDPHGADLRGNPLGGIVFSNAWSGDNNTYVQAVEWHNFMGSNSFCFKICDPSGPNAAHYCEHVYDRIGCAYNAPHNAPNNTFQACKGDNQDFPGVYTDPADGQDTSQFGIVATATSGAGASGSAAASGSSGSGTGSASTRAGSAAAAGSTDEASKALSRNIGLGQDGTSAGMMIGFVGLLFAGVFLL
ncbi:macrofage activating glyco [Pyrrhoderma noxium]|uniref:Macrofage activating glyco n=1 Tax=Pyrrhoderma noxium TaxID=2282107 RepID=A0A286U9Q7_9AGAM|nr:macrofage activating glyco [Pyrrhoderma noxium]